MKRILVIAGPNGAGKTTTASTLIPDLPMLYEFINADEIAKGLAPLHPESVALAASKLMIHRLRELLKANKSFAFETTGAGTNYLKHLKEAKNKGYEINLLFLWLSNVQQALNRVAQREEQGGHYIAPEVIRRRYYSGLKNLIMFYLPIADIGLIVENSLEEQGKLILSKHLGRMDIHDPQSWKKIQDMAHG